MSTNALMLMYNRGMARKARGRFALVAVLAGLCAACSPSTKQTAGSGSGTVQSWDSFWKDFQKAASEKDKGALRGFMTERFDHSFGGGEQTPEAAFRSWDRPEIDGWSALAKVVAAGAVDYVPPPQWELKGKVRVAPPEAASGKYIQWRAVFEQSDSGQWRFVAFLNGD